MVFLYNEILKKWSTDACDKRDALKNIMLSERSQTLIIWFHFYEMSKVGKSIEIEIFLVA